MSTKTLLSWSTGKDSAWALKVLQEDPTVQLEGLFCTINKTFERVAMHAVRVELLEAQAKAVGLPLMLIEIPYPCSHQQYEAAMSAFIEQAKASGIEQFAFGDLFLEDVRQYREQQLQGTGIMPIFPLWGLDTQVLSCEMVNAGLKAVLTCIDPNKLPAYLAGCPYDIGFLQALQQTYPDVDPCGEYGEFHSFAYAGPMFIAPIPIVKGERVERDGFVFRDVMLDK